MTGVDVDTRVTGKTRVPRVTRVAKNSWGGWDDNRVIEDDWDDPNPNILKIRHFHISHTAPSLPPKILHKHCFQFPLKRLKYPGEMKNKGYPKFRGANKVPLMGNVEVAND